MVKRFLILLFLSVSVVFRSFSQNTGTDGKLRTILQQYGQAEVTIQYTDREAVDILSRNVSILSVRDKIIYLSLSPVTLEWFLQQNYNYSISEKKRTRVLSRQQI